MDEKTAMSGPISLTAFSKCDHEVELQTRANAARLPEGKRWCCCRDESRDLLNQGESRMGVLDETTRSKRDDVMLGSGGMEGLVEVNFGGRWADTIFFQ